MANEQHELKRNLEAQENLRLLSDKAVVIMENHHLEPRYWDNNLQRLQFNRLWLSALEESLSGDEHHCKIRLLEIDLHKEKELLNNLQRGDKEIEVHNKKISQIQSQLDLFDRTFTKHPRFNVDVTSIYQKLSSEMRESFKTEDLFYEHLIKILKRSTETPDSDWKKNFEYSILHYITSYSDGVSSKRGFLNNGFLELSNAHKLDYSFEALMCLFEYLDLKNKSRCHTLSIPYRDYQRLFGSQLHLKNKVGNSSESKIEVEALNIIKISQAKHLTQYLDETQIKNVVLYDLDFDSIQDTAIASFINCLDFNFDEDLLNLNINPTLFPKMMKERLNILNHVLKNNAHIPKLNFNYGKSHRTSVNIVISENWEEWLLLSLQGSSVKTLFIQSLEPPKDVPKTGKRDYFCQAGNGPKNVELFFNKLYEYGIREVEVGAKLFSSLPSAAQESVLLNSSNGEVIVSPLNQLSIEARIKLKAENTEFIKRWAQIAKNFSVLDLPRQDHLIQSMANLDCEKNGVDLSPLSEGLQGATFRKLNLHGFKLNLVNKKSLMEFLKVILYPRPKHIPPLEKLDLSAIDNKLFESLSKEECELLGLWVTQSRVKSFNVNFLVYFTESINADLLEKHEYFLKGLKGNKSLLKMDFSSTLSMYANDDLKERCYNIENEFLKIFVDNLSRDVTKRVALRIGAELNDLHNNLGFAAPLILQYSHHIKSFDKQEAHDPENLEGLNFS